MPASCSLPAALVAWLPLCLPAQLVIPPTHQPTFHGSDNVQSFAFAPDRPVLYVNAHAPSVNLWPNIVALWPELLGAVAALATLVFIFVAVRLSRRPRRRGIPYCRRCNYDLSAHVRPSTDAKRPGFTWDPAALCPECGAKLDRARPIRGRPLLLRLAPALTLWLVIVLPYAAMWAFRLPRSGSANQWLDLSSRWAAEHLDHWSIRWLSPKKVDSDCIVEIDLASGLPTRTIATRATRTFFPLTIAPDGSALFLAGVGAALDAVSTRTGRLQRSVRLPGEPMVDLRHPSVVGFAADGASAYVQWWAHARNLGGVSRWPWRTGGPIETLCEEPGFVDTSQARSSNWPRIFVFRDHAGPSDPAGHATPRFLTIPNFMEAFPTGKYIVRLHEHTVDARSFDVQPLPDPMQRPAFSPDARTLFLAAGHGRSTTTLDLELGVASAAPEPAGQWMAASQCGRYIAHAVDSTSVRVRDTVERKWTLSLKPPASLYAPRPLISPDGRWIAAVCQGGGRSSGASGGAFVQRLVIWDLRDHPLVESSSHDAPPPGPAPAPPPP